jgi:hypothetical protein
VRIGWHGTMKLGDGQSIHVKDDNGVKQKRRMVMLDGGMSWLDAETLRDLLIATYDLLESELIVYATLFFLTPEI